MSRYDPPPSWYDPPEPPEPCCADGEDDPDHDSAACLAEQAEQAAEQRAEQMADHWGFDR